MPATENPIADLSSAQAEEAVRESVEFVKATHDYGAQSTSFSVDVANGFRQKANLTGAGSIVITAPTLSNRVNRLLFFLDVSAFTGTLTFTGVTSWEGASLATPRIFGRNVICLLFLLENLTGPELRGIDLGDPGDTAIPFETEAGTSYTAVLADAGLNKLFTAATAVTYTIPPNSSVAYKLGTILPGVQYGAGQVTLTPGAGVTLNSPASGLKTTQQYSSFCLQKVGTDEWLVSGDLTA